MNEMKGWAFSLCCAAVGGALFSLLLPDSSAGKTGRFAIQLFMLCCLISPLSDLKDISLTIPQIQYTTANRTSEISNVVNDQVKEQTANALCRMAEEILDEYQILYQKVETIVNTAPDGSISIDCIRILLPSDVQEDSPDFRLDLAMSAVTEATGVQTVLAAESGGTQHGF